MSSRDPATSISVPSYFVFSIYGVMLWAYAASISHKRFAWLFLVSWIIGLLVSVANLLLYIDPRIAERVFGSGASPLLYYSFICAQPIETVIALIGSTLLVCWIRDLLRPPKP